MTRHSQLHGRMNGYIGAHAPGRPVIVPADQLGNDMPEVTLADKERYGLVTWRELLDAGADEDWLHNWIQLGRIVPVAKIYRLRESETRNGRGGQRLFHPKQIRWALRKWPAPVKKNK